MNGAETAARLREIAGAEAVLTDEPMSRHTTFRIGGPADFLVTPGSVPAVRGAVAFCREEGIPFTVIGNGSNLLVSDEGFRGVIICLGKDFSGIRAEGGTITAEAGALLKRVAAAAEENSLTGMEFAGGIPGTLGGACIMNAGAYGGEMKQVLVEAQVLDRDGEVRTIPAGEMGLGYRTSVFTKEGMIVLSAVIRLAKGDPGEIRRVSEDFRERRQSKQPLDMPSAGSTFKRPEGYFAGKLIMDAGLSGFSVGGAQVSPKHYGFVVNTGGATAADVRELIREVQRRVSEQSGVMLEPEVRFL